MCHKVCNKQFPPCNLSEEDLLQNPYFSKLLLSLSQHVDESGLSLTLAEEQAQVRVLGGGTAGRGEKLKPAFLLCGMFRFSRLGRRCECIRQYG